VPKVTNEHFDKVVFQAGNKHSVSCGRPPYIDASVQDRYHGYFENEHREQFIFVYDYQTKKATLWVGDNGWETPVAVIDGEAPELYLNGSEQMWLQACWNAATAFIGT
jgi:hypothetical protein